MSAAAFSSDGSLLAAAAGDQVALWDPDSSAVISCLASPLANYASPLRKLCFIPNSPYLVGYTTGVSPSLIAWNIVTESVCWSYQLAVSAIAADPMGGLLAVAVLPKSSGANAQGGRDSHSNKEASEQAEGGAFSHGNIRSPEVQEVRHSMTVTQSDNHQAAAASAVFLLHAATGLPELSWNLEQSVAAALLFPLPGTQLHASSVPLMPDGLSAFMIVLQDRQYAIARSANCMHNADMQAMFLKQRQELSTFEAGFGKAVMLQLAEYGPGSAVLQSEGQGRFQMVFNAPSHVLPSLADLAPTFFDCLVEHSIFAGV